LDRLSQDPEISVELMREGELVHTDLSRLSVGEKCSAVLSIALLNKRRPLVIDQPEDDLDHGFVTQSVVESLRSAKQQRQVIAATHNPNIPVLGDADLVIRVERVPGQELCRVKVRGGLELPEVTREVQMLEGGPEAFERRRRRYAAS
jgi:ABC-type lipoprotein export system ATPase subunit